VSKLSEVIQLLIVSILISSYSFSLSFVFIYVDAQKAQKPQVKITYPDAAQNVPAGGLTIYGISSDTHETPCQISVLLNEERPYQNATATGLDGKDDYSKWTFTFDPYYSLIREGVNQLISKIVCHYNDGTEKTGWNEIYLIGVGASKANSTNQSQLAITTTSPGVVLYDPTLKVEVVAEGLTFPTTMAFLGPDDFLILEKNNGTVKRISNHTMQPDLILDVNVANKHERGMLGVAVSHEKLKNGSAYVFLYYTETDMEGSDICPKANKCNTPSDHIRNRLYRYEFVNDKLVNPKLLMDLPASPIPTHNGGKILIGPDKNVYFTIGDLYHRTITQNFPNNLDSNGTSAIYRISQDGKAVEGILSEDSPLNKYYAYGIRNSFGIDFDPITGRLWDTENGPASNDELNLVEPGFNSGWRGLMGMAPAGFNFSNLVNFDGEGKYSDPEFVWEHVVGPTAIKFFHSDELGARYHDDVFVGDYHQGIIYHFELHPNRTDLALDGPLLDKIANLPDELESIKFGEGFGAVTDIQTGPYDGYLYIVSYGHGKIYRIVQAGKTST
jgi:glucose/arabinose dehydrogenase